MIDSIRNILILLSVICIFNTDLNATHNRSGEITYKQVGPLTISATITTYTKASSTAADRDSLLMIWGDGSSEMISRSNGNGELIPGEDIKVNYYTAEHTYPGRATYTISFEDPNRVNNIINVNYPNSVDVPFFVSTTFTLINTQFQGFNNSVVLLQPPIDFACNNQRFVHNPNAYDIDGDSLSYELVVPLQAEGEEVPDYRFPSEVSAGPDNQIYLDPITGDFIWDSPKQTGEYNIAIKINEYRNGVLLNSVIRDMQIRVQACQSLPPSLELVEELCVVAGERIEIDVTADDPDPGQLVRISATGGPFLLDYSKAVFTGDLQYEEAPSIKSFIWDTKCEHISDNFYQVVFRAQDNSINNNSGLAVLKTLKIKVVGPAPENLSADVNDQQIDLSWDLPYQCEETINDYFLGFSVWRRINTKPIEEDDCKPGLDGQGYEVIRFNTKENDGQSYLYTDTDVVKGKIYCYRILANFAQQTSSGNPYNIVESLPSNEICLQLVQDIPLLTKVDVLNTSQTNGEIEVNWIKSKAEDLDTIENPGPYRYVLTRSVDNNIYNEIPNAVFETTGFSDPIDLKFIDTGLNTQNIQYYYAVDFYTGGDFYGSSPISSSVFIQVSSSDQRNQLSWDFDTSWENYSYNLFRKSETDTQFELITTTSSLEYLDRDVENEMDYCYKVESLGTYGLDNTPEFILNFSQESCGIPIDTLGPCTPELSVQNPCTNNEINDPEVELINYLSWARSDFICDDSDDVAFYKIYFSSSLAEPAQLIATLTKDENAFEHLPDDGINGCYRISAVDSLGNEGMLSDFICVNNCPIYKLPNTFTPNFDGSNELFVPIENRFVAEVNFQVFNRWGNKVFETQDPELNWDAKDLQNKELDQGTYYYSCEVYDTDNDGFKNRVAILSGYIQILR